MLMEQTKDKMWSAEVHNMHPVHMSVLTVGQTNERREGAQKHIPRRTALSELVVLT